MPRGAHDGLTWTHRPGCERLLAAVSAATWANPEAQANHHGLTPTAGWERVKRNARREVWRAVIHGKPYYLKYYFSGVWRDLVTNIVQPPACQAEYEGGLFARRAGISAVRPLAYTQNLRRKGRRCALLITEALEPAQPLDEFWRQLQSDEDPQRQRSDSAMLIDQLAQMIARAHQAGFEHRDMHAANILVQPLAPRRYRTVFVDLHSARQGVPLSGRAVVRNLAQLNQWFRKHSTIGDRLRLPAGLSALAQRVRGHLCVRLPARSAL